MVNIDSSVVIQLINFLVLIIVLNIILFKPIRRIMQERSQGIADAFSDAKSAQEKMQSIFEQYNSAMAEAKQKAASTYNTTYQQGLDAQREMISAERAKAGELLNKARAEIAAASAAAQADLKKEAKKLSKDITEKLLGRAV